MREKQFDIIEKMLEEGYFRDKKEYIKAIKWAKRGLIPRWFRKDMNEYERKVKNAKASKR